MVSTTWGGAGESRAEDIRVFSSGAAAVAQRAIVEQGIGGRTDFLSGHTIQFTVDHVHQIARNGQPLADIDSQEDSTATNNTILGVIRALALDDQCAIHASIAGGRKTMGGALQILERVIYLADPGLMPCAPQRFAMRRRQKTLRAEGIRLPEY